MTTATAHSRPLPARKASAPAHRSIGGDRCIRSGSWLERLEPRLALAADVGSAIHQVAWNGREIAARADAWIMRAEIAPATGWNLAPQWSTSSLGEGFYALSAPGASTQEVLGWAARPSGVSYVEPDFVISPAMTSNDPSLGQLWGLNNVGQSGGVADADIDAPEAWNTTTGSRSVVVAVIDTGMDSNHPDLAANAWRNPGEIPGDGRADEIVILGAHLDSWDLGTGAHDDATGVGIITAAAKLARIALSMSPRCPFACQRA